MLRSLKMFQIVIDNVYGKAHNLIDIIIGRLMERMRNETSLCVALTDWWRVTGRLSLFTKYRNNLPKIAAAFRTENGT